MKFILRTYSNVTVESMMQNKLINQQDNIFWFKLEDDGTPGCLTQAELSDLIKIFKMFPSLGNIVSTLNCEAKVPIKDYDDWISLEDLAKSKGLNYQSFNLTFYPVAHWV